MHSWRKIKSLRPLPTLSKYPRLWKISNHLHSKVSKNQLTQKFSRQKFWVCEGHQNLPSKNHKSQLNLWYLNKTFKIFNFFSMGSQMKDGEDSGPQILGFILNFKFQNKLKNIYKHPSK